jgi:hypothetical protein
LPSAPRVLLNGAGRTRTCADYESPAAEPDADARLYVDKDLSLSRDHRQRLSELPAATRDVFSMSMGRQLGRRIPCAAAMCIACCLGAVDAPAASALEYEEVPPEVQPAPIVAGRLVRGDVPTTAPGRRTFTFSVPSGFCVGSPKPRFDHVRVVEQPKTVDRPFKSTVITAFLLYPAHLRAIPPSPPPPNVAYNACAGIGLNLTKRIKLRRPAANLFYYDGSHSPPRRVWPPLDR